MYTYELYFKLCLKQATTTTTTTITSVCIFFKQNQKQNIKKKTKKNPLQSGTEIKIFVNYIKQKQGMVFVKRDRETN